jgi:endonuclease/exonuclease/phosphatase family metal-dependent hydrolase
VSRFRAVLVEGVEMPTFRRVMRARLAVMVALLLILAVGLPAAAHGRHRDGLTVMTQNLYTGADFTPMLEAPDATAFLIAGAAAYATVINSNFPARAAAIAREIDDGDADLIGLQEVSNWTVTGAVPSYDFLEILLGALAARGLDYSVAAVSDNLTVGPLPLLLCPPGACYLTYHDRDVILVNNDSRRLRVAHPQSGHYALQNVTTTKVGLINWSRGWASVDGSFGGERFTFVTTHLETEEFPAIQEAQAVEFLAGPARARGAVIAAGDFNSAADGSTTQSYETLTRSFFDDAWRINRHDPGYSCCQNETLSNPTSILSDRRDLVLTHDARASQVDLVGDSPFQASAPFWTSDHAGLAAEIRLH